MVEVVNRQTTRRIIKKRWSEFAERALRAIGTPKKNSTVVFVSDHKIRELNRQFRGRDYATDVLSFPHQPEAFEDQTDLGQLVISVPRAVAQAKQNDLSFDNEVEQLILHGLLHLCGYDHETDDGEMNRLELTLRKRLGI